MWRRHSRHISTSQELLLVKTVNLLTISWSWFLSRWSSAVFGDLTTWCYLSCFPVFLLMLGQFSASVSRASCSADVLHVFPSCPLGSTVNTGQPAVISGPARAANQLTSQMGGRGKGCSVLLPHHLPYRVKHPDAPRDSSINIKTSFICLFLNLPARYRYSKLRAKSNI